MANEKRISEKEQTTTRRCKSEMRFNENCIATQADEGQTQKQRTHSRRHLTKTSERSAQKKEVSASCLRKGLQSMRPAGERTSSKSAQFGSKPLVTFSSLDTCHMELELLCPR